MDKIFKNADIWASEAEWCSNRLSINRDTNDGSESDVGGEGSGGSTASLLRIIGVSPTLVGSISIRKPLIHTNFI